MVNRGTSGTVINTTTWMNRLSQSFPASYTVWTDGVTCRAESNITGGTDYSDTNANAAIVINSALAALTGGRTWKERVAFRGNFSLSALVNVPSYTILDLGNAKFTPTALLNCFIIDGKDRVEIRGGIIDGAGVGDNGVYITGSYDVLVENLVSISNLYRGISCYINANGKIKLLNNYLWNNGKWDIDVYQSSYTKVLNNYCLHASDGVDKDGIVVKESWKCHVSGNHCINNGDTGIALIDSKYNLVHGNIIEGSYYNGIYLDGAVYESVYDNEIIECSREGSQCGIKLEPSPTPTNPTYNTIRDNLILDERTPKKHVYGLQEAAGGDYNVIENNRIAGYLTGAIVTAGANTKVYRNQGYVTENSGTSAIASGTTSIEVTHGCSFTPTIADITITPSAKSTSDPTFYYWVDGITSAHFHVNVAVDPGVLTFPFGWAVRKV
jgi:parallel beta-helix repeat protein